MNHLIQLQNNQIQQHSMAMILYHHECTNTHTLPHPIQPPIDTVCVIDEAFRLMLLAIIDSPLQYIEYREI